jgi:pimeloyl-ACP methyl ester carboxylesterase
VDEAKYREAERKLWAQVGLDPRERVVTLAQSGARIRVQIVGEGLPVLFIHGGPNAGSTWAPLLEFFNGFKSYIVDRPGTGLSPAHPMTAETLPRFADNFVRDALTALGLERAHVVGSSLGGYIALRGAAAHPGRVCRMVQISCPAFAPGMQVPAFMKLMTVAPVRRIMNTMPPNERVGRSILRQIGHSESLEAGRIPEPFFDWYQALQRYTDTMHNDGELIAGVGSIRGFDPSLTLTDRLLGSITTPTLFLWGEDDAFGGVDVASHVVSVMPHAELDTMAGSGHLPWLDDPKRMATETAAFLAADIP